MNTRPVHKVVAVIFLLIGAFSLTHLLSCSGFDSENIPMSVRVDDMETVLVINGEIELDSTVWVELEYTLDIDLPANTPRKFENNASLSLSNGSAAEELLLIANGRYEGSIIKGEVGKTYTLTVRVGDQSYTGTSTMFPPPGYDTAWVVSGQVVGKLGSYLGYSEEWKVKDPSATRDRYLFEWWTNGEHLTIKDWAIDDNRVVNAGEALRLFNPTIDPEPNQRVRFRASEIDKITYDYFNMYEKIVRKLVSVSSQTPYNPVSNLGAGTIGNFRAVAFSDYYVLTLPPITSQRGNQCNTISWEEANEEFAAMNLYWDTKPSITVLSPVIKSIKEKNYNHKNLVNGTTYFYRIQVVDALGYGSPLSEEFSLIPTDSILPPSLFSALGDSAIVALSWRPHEKAVSHTLYWDTKTGVSTESNKIPSITDTTFTHTNLVNGTRYYYRMSSTDSMGNVSELSKEISAKAGGEGPQNVIATASSGKVALVWDAVSGGISYSIYGDTIPGISTKSPLIIDKLTETSYTHHTPNSGSIWYYKVGVWLFNQDQNSYMFHLSKEVNATPLVSK